jgi:hypothetical protein
MVAFMSGAELFVRVTFSLGLVLGLIWFSARVLRRRGISGLRAPSSRGGRVRNEIPFEVLARTGVTRTSALTALRFGDRVLLVGSADGEAPTVLASVEAATWVPVVDPTATRADPATLDVPGLAPSDAVEFLRSVTSRRPR